MSNDSPHREWVTPYAAARCPTCLYSVFARDDGSLFEHVRYADGSGPYPNEPHNTVPCVGEGCGIR